MERLIDACSDRRWKLIDMPAPHASALRWKLDYILADDSGGSLQPYAHSALQQMFEDIDQFLPKTPTPAGHSPDMVKQPIEGVIANLASLHDDYPTAFLAACDNAGVTVSVSRNAQGEDGLILGCPYDEHGDLRRKHHDAFCALFRSRPEHRQAIIDLVNASGVFVDEQPYSSARELVRDFCAAGGWFAVYADGRLEHPLPYSEEAWAAESARGYPLRRLAQRLEVTLWKRAARDELAALIRAYGNLHEGGHWHVLKAPEAARLVDEHATGTPFDAAEWLARFKANGGECWIAEGKAYIGARLDGNEEAEIRAANMMREYRASKEIADAVKCHLLSGRDDHTPDPASVFNLSTSPKGNA